MSSTAIDHYLLLTEISYDYGLIDIFTYEKRMEFVFKGNNKEQSFEENRENEFVVKESNDNNNSPSEEPFLALFTARVGALGSVWKFTLGDPDNYPSIPHGHLKTNLKIKLDSYLGYTYDTSNGNKKLKREDRNYIKALWNDQDFRDFAIKQINWYIFNNPHFRWRVKSPRILPRRRP